MRINDVIVIGAGPAGLMAAARAAQMGATVLVLEKNKMVGRKLRITGKGRCNISNKGDIEDYMAQFGSQGRFLYSSFHRFFHEELEEVMALKGVALKVERGQRIFPESDDAHEVAKALENFALESGARIWTNTPVTDLTWIGTEGRGSLAQVEIKTKNGLEIIQGKTVILATGGLSYPLTGSTGDGYLWAKALGHHIQTPRPALVPFETEESWPGELSGLTLKNVQARLCSGDGAHEHCLGKLQGELLFAHFGVTGPIILTLSRSYQAELTRPVRLYIDLKPALTEEQLDLRLQRDFKKYEKKQLRNALVDLLPKAMVPVVISLAQLEGDMPVAQISRGQRRKLLGILKGLPLTIRGTRPMDEAIITAGGIDTKEIDPKTMASRLQPQLFFAGEIMDIDGNTGGYNLQAAFSTGWTAGEEAAEKAVRLRESVKKEGGKVR